MNFTSEIKREIFSAMPKRRCCEVAAISALLMTSGTVTDGTIEFVSENERSAQTFLRMTEDAFDVRFEMQNATFDPKRERDKLTFSYRGERTDDILRETGLLETDPIARFMQRECCALAYLKGAFVGGGSCTIPNGDTRTGYHLEFIFPNRSAGEAFLELLASFDLLAKSVTRGGKAVVYSKSGDQLSDFVSVIGAKNALKTLDGVTAERAERNNSNRISNCYAKNADRAAIASVNQLRMIEELKQRGALETLSPALREVAQARTEYPAESLSELAARLGISKSCLNHRIRKLTEIHQNTGKTL